LAINLSTESLARASSRRPWITIGIWIALLVVAMVLNTTLLGSATTTEFRFTNGVDSQRALDLLEDRLRGPRPMTEMVIIQSASMTVDDPVFQAKAEGVFTTILGLGPEVIAGGQNYYQGADEGLVSADRKTTIMPLVMTGELDEATANIEGVLDIIAEENEASDFQVLIAGDISIPFETNELSQKDIEKGERIGVPVALIILLVLFGTVLAAFIPIGLAIVSIIVALGATAVIGQYFDLIFFVTLMISMIGLAVGIDYSLIVVSRFREELARGLSTHEAVAKAGSTAGRTVLFSGVTVVLALSGMLIIPASVFQGLGTGAILVVIAAVAASLTLLPAILTTLGPKVNLLRLPFLGRKPANHSDTNQKGFWEFVTRNVMRFPIISLVVVAGLMLAASASYLDLETGFNGVDTLPDTQTKAAFFILEEEFSFGVVSPAEIVIDGPINSPGVQAAIADLTAAIIADPDFQNPPRALEVNAAGDLALLAVPVPGEPGGPAALAAVAKLRNQYIPAAFSGVDADVMVGGISAFNTDFFAIADTYRPIMFAFVLSLSFLLLMVVFRSIVIPLKAILMNLLSVGTAYGLLVLVFQKGVGADLLGFTETPIIDAWIPLFLFSVLFGLSMDYHVFLLSRIKERYDQTHDNNEAVAYGLRSTAGLITGAALIMVAVFGGFAAGDTVGNQQVGFGLAIAIFLDATLVRSVLVPASMRLLGKWNWYLPSWLHWLPDFQVEPVEQPSLTDSKEV
jgi:RND superfamily putative drug exporter